jgi:hypothetical protein
MIDVLTASKYEVDLEQILDDVATHYFIKNEDETVAIIPADEYLTLHEIYEEWIQTKPPEFTLEEL